MSRQDAAAVWVAWPGWGRGVQGRTNEQASRRRTKIQWGDARTAGRTASGILLAVQKTGPRPPPPEPRGVCPKGVRKRHPPIWRLMNPFLALVPRSPWQPGPKQGLQPGGGIKSWLGVGHTRQPPPKGVCALGLLAPVLPPGTCPPCPPFRCSVRCTPDASGTVLRARSELARQVPVPIAVKPTRSVPPDPRRHESVAPLLLSTAQSWPPEGWKRPTETKTRAQPPGGQCAPGPRRRACRMMCE